MGSIDTATQWRRLRLVVGPRPRRVDRSASSFPTSRPWDSKVPITTLLPLRWRLAKPTTNVREISRLMCPRFPEPRISGRPHTFSKRWAFLENSSVSRGTSEPPRTRFGKTLRDGVCNYRSQIRSQHIYNGRTSFYPRTNLVVKLSSVNISVLLFGHFWSSPTQ